METHASIIWEQAKGLIFVDRIAHPEDAQFTEVDFDAMMARMTPQIDYKGFDHYFRYNWLVQNGYEVTHENMIDATLPTHPDLVNTRPELAKVYSKMPPGFQQKYDNLQQKVNIMDTAVLTASKVPNGNGNIVAILSQALQDVAGV